MNPIKALLCLLATVWPAAAFSQVMRIDLNAADLSRGLLTSRVRVPVPDDVQSDGGEMPLWFPKWVPGTHGPTGPITDVAGMTISAEFESGAPDEVLNWTRTPGEVYRVVADVPAGATTLLIEMAASAGVGNSGTQASGAPAVGVINANTVVLYREGDSASEITVQGRLALPNNWTFGTALETADRIEQGPFTIVTFAETSLEDFIDSPIVLGRFGRVFELNAGDAPDFTPPHRLHVVSEIPTALEFNEDLLEDYRAVVTEASLLFGSHPFESFDILLVSTDQLGRSGLEHQRSTLNVLPRDTMLKPAINEWWPRLLIPHEYVHAWCGKYRRPAGMATDDYHTPKNTELLWVYEGLTQYLGQVLEVRAGLMDEAKFVHALHDQVMGLRKQQGRRWRPLVDTARSSHLLRSGGGRWGGLKRNQAYYFEGALFWLEADALIRRLTEGEKSLDDFCRLFFAHAEGDPVPKPFMRDDVIAALNEIVPSDWDGFWRSRVDVTLTDLPLTGITSTGYQLTFKDEPQHSSKLDHTDGLGVSVSNGGTITTVILGSPADRARLAPGMKIVGVNQLVFSADNLAIALALTEDSGEIELTLASGESLERRTIAYDGGLRYPHLGRIESRPNVLADILAPRREITDDENADD
ncbi:MAG: hypothetical protein AAGI17_07145 [Planctomycetota bacterium]